MKNDKVIMGLYFKNERELWYAGSRTTRYGVTYPDFVEEKELAVSVHLFELELLMGTIYMFEEYHLFDFEFDGILVEKESKNDLNNH